MQQLNQVNDINIIAKTGLMQQLNQIKDINIIAKTG